jgi:hypothetical protein
MSSLADCKQNIKILPCDATKAPHLVQGRFAVNHVSEVVMVSSWLIRPQACGFEVGLGGTTAGLGVRINILAGLGGLAAREMFSKVIKSINSEDYQKKSPAEKVVKRAAILLSSPSCPKAGADFR